ncbi:DUF4147 domain-containing protein [bacterium]|nr:DUF4147 domain-containing protein [bacterium]
MFASAQSYIDFLKSLPIDFSDYEKIRDREQNVVISVGKSADYMYGRFIKTFPEAASLPSFAVLPQGSGFKSLKAENVVFSTHPHMSEASFAACERLINFIKVQNPENAVVLLSGGSSALIEKSADMHKTVSLNEKILKSGLPITEMNRLRSGNSLIKNGKLAELFSKTGFYVFVASDIPYSGGEKFVGSMPFYRENLENTRLFKCADSDLLHDALLRQLPENTVSIRRFTGKTGELAGIILHHIEAGTENLLVTGEPLLKIESENPGCGGRMSHLALMMLPHLKAGMKLFALSSDGIDGNSPFAGAIVEGGKNYVSESEAGNSLKTYNSAELLNKFNCMIESGYTGINLNDFVVFQRNS